MWHHPIRISASTFDKSRRLNRADCSCHRACTVRSTNFALPLLISPMINYVLSRPPICNNSDLHGFQLNEAPIEYSLFFHELMHTRASSGLRLLNRIINFNSTRVRFVLGNSYRFEWEKRSFDNFPSRERSLVLVCREIDGTIALSKERFLNSTILFILFSF